MRRDDIIFIYWYFSIFFQGLRPDSYVFPSTFQQIYSKTISIENPTVKSSTAHISIMKSPQFSLHLLSQMSRGEQVSMMKKTSKIQDHILISIGVWNLQGMLPPTNSVKIFMQELIKQDPDLICISTQECQRSITMSFFCQNKEEWENCLKESGSGYKLVDSETMRAMHTAILVREDLVNCFTTERKDIMRAGTCNIFGNKGAVSMVVNLLGQNFQFINCHLEAHQDACPRRNEILLRIADQLVEKDYRNEIFICGDLNYRIDMTHEEYYALVKGKTNTEKQMHYLQMLSKDQLYLQQDLKDRFFPFFKQQRITFPPTYKIGDETQQYDKKRIPGWTDRIFHRKGRAKQLGYRCMYELYGTDHRPIIGTFKVQTEETLSIFPEDFVAVKTRESCALI